MVQQRINPARQYLGPWLGLNTTLDPSQLPPGWAQKARNVILSDGMVRPRRPWRAEGTRTAFRRVGFSNPLGVNSGLRIVSIVQVNATGDDLGRIIMKTVSPRIDAEDTAGAIWVAEAGGTQRQLSISRNSSPADFVVVGEWVYVLDGGDRLIKVKSVRGDTGPSASRQALFVGITAPPATIATLSVVAGSLGQSLEYGITYFHDPTGIESNMTELGAITPTASEDVKITFSYGSADRILGEGITDIRIYRKNNTQGQIGFRLIATIDFNENFDSDFVHTDSQDEEDITVSSDVTGPFGPTRNALLTKASIGAMHGGRLFYATPLDTQSTLRFSAVGVPDYAEPDDFLVVRGDKNEGINGLLSLGTTLYVGKEKAIWSQTGEIHTATNKTNATGAAVLDNPAEQLIRTPATVGPQDQGGGNGFALAGEPGRIHFANSAGLYDFDGINTRKLSDAIERTWRAFNGRTAVNEADVMSFADDPVLGVLYVCAGAKAELPEHFILAYHYRMNRGDGIGAFTTIDAKGSPPAFDVADGRFPTDGKLAEVISSITGAVVPPFEVAGNVANPQDVGQSLLLLGMADGSIARSEHEGVAPGVITTPRGVEFEYQTGDMPMLFGHEKHVYFAKFFFGRTGRNGLVGRFLVKLVVELDRDVNAVALDSAAAKLIVDLAQRGNETGVLPVRGDGSTVTISFSKEVWDEGFDPQLGLIGYELQTELVGRI